MKAAGGSFSAAFIGLPSYSPSVHAQSTDTIRIGVPPFVNQSAIFLAQEMGWFAKSGINLRLQSFPDGSLIVAPLLSGEVDIGVVTCSAGLFNSMSRGAPFKAFLCNGQGKAGRSGSAIAVTPKLYEQGVRGPADLARVKGKTIAVPAAGSVNQYGIASALQQVKLDPVSEVKWQTSVSMPDTVKQMGQNQIEIADISYQLAYLGQKQNICRLIASGDQLLPDIQTTMSAVRNNVKAERRDAIIRFAMAYIHAGRLFNKVASNPAQYPDALEAIVKYTLVKDIHILKDIAPHWEWIAENGVPNADSVMAQQDFWNNPFKMVERKVSRDQILDLSIAAEASARLERDKPFDT